MPEDGPRRRTTKHTNATSDTTREIVKKIDHEIPRKVLHSSIGFVTLYLYLNKYQASSTAAYLAPPLAVIALVDAVRLSQPEGPFARLYERVLGFLMRKEERYKVNGVVWYICGCGFSLLVFPRDLAVVSILVLSWADTAASTIGRLVPSGKLPTSILGIPLAPRKSRAGTLAAILTAATIAAGFWGILRHPYPSHELSWSWKGGLNALTSPLLSNPWLTVAKSWMPAFKDGAASGRLAGLSGIISLSFITGLIGGVIEALDVASLDDNLTLPILTGGALWAVITVIVRVQ